MRFRNHRPAWRGFTRIGFIGAAAALTASVVLVAPSSASVLSSSAATPDAGTCSLGNGIKHVVQITFDNVHFFRDNPNVPSDLEMMPNLLNFIEGNGVMLSNNHTPLIAHTSDDVVTTLTGLYGDRHGMGIGNSFRAFNPDGTSRLASAFTYWTDPINYTQSGGLDTNPNTVYSPVPPATSGSPVPPTTVAPAPWVPYTRAGCNVGYVGTANVELENPSYDIPKVFGVNSPENQQVLNDPDSFKDAETADYVGVAVHCAQDNAFCSSATDVKYGQTSPSASETPDLLPQEPGGYLGYQALFGHRYVAPQLGAGTPNLSQNGFQVTNAAGNLVDENGNQINGAFTSSPGFPGFSNINASQTLAYLADMLASGVPVVGGYISDIHGNEFIPALSGAGGPCQGAPSALGPGSACYVAQAQYYNQAFGTFFQRLAAMGINSSNTLFEFSSDEGDHVAGANVGRSIQPTPANCDGATVSGDTVTPDVLCTYPSGSFGELAGNLTGLLNTQQNDTTPFSLENDTAPEFYVNGQPGPTAPAVRTLEHDVAALTASNPYTGGTQAITNYLADPTEEALLHFVDADPARTPTFALFAKPDYYLSTGPATCTACVVQSSGFAYDHGDYAPEINTNWVGFVGPGVSNLGLDGSGPADGPNSAGANSGQGTIPGENTTGTWVDETDIRPTMMYLLGLHDDYVHDGRVITPILASPNKTLANPAVEALGVCYKQLDSSVGLFGTDTLIADTNAIESTSPGDTSYLDFSDRLLGLAHERDNLAGRIKVGLDGAAFSNRPIANLQGDLQDCNNVLSQAAGLAG